MQFSFESSSFWLQKEDVKIFWQIKMERALSSSSVYIEFFADADDDDDCDVIISTFHHFLLLKFKIHLV